MSAAKSRPDHRGAPGNIAAFARQFINGRLEGFQKDIKICLTPGFTKNNSRPTHAYFPALGACCGLLEYLAGLYRGNLERLGWPDVANFAEKFLPQPDFDRETVRVLVEAFRHPVAHRGIASGIWIDRKPGSGHGRRITWKIWAKSERPACHIVDEPGVLRIDPPWPSPYSHRVHIHLRRFASDLRRAAKQLGGEIQQSAPLQAHFLACMKQLYPAQ
jgi:hypothetical protein